MNFSGTALAVPDFVIESTERHTFVKDGYVVESHNVLSRYFLIRRYEIWLVLLFLQRKQ